MTMPPGATSMNHHQSVNAHFVPDFDNKISTLLLANIYHFKNGWFLPFNAKIPLQRVSSNLYLFPSDCTMVSSIFNNKLIQKLSSSSTVYHSTKSISSYILGLSVMTGSHVNDTKLPAHLRLLHYRVTPTVTLHSKTVRHLICKE